MLSQLKYNLKLYISEIPDRFWQWLVRKLPNKLRYFAAIDVWSYATTGKWGKDHPTDLKVETALRRFESKIKGEDNGHGQ